MANTTRIKTPLTMSRAESDRRLIEELRSLKKDLTAVADGLERIFGPPPRPDLKVVQEDEDDG